MPALVCGSFSDNNLHGRGSFRGWQQITSPEKFLYTHRGGKLAEPLLTRRPRCAAGVFRPVPARGRRPAPPRVRLEVRQSRDVITSVRDEDDWPLDRARWTPLYLTAAGLTATPPSADGQITFDVRSQGVRCDWVVPADTEVTGPMALRLFIEARGAADINLFAGVEKWRGRTYIGFEGSYGFGRDRITTGWLKASLRELDQRASQPPEPGYRRCCGPGCGAAGSRPAAQLDGRLIPVAEAG